MTQPPQQPIQYQMPPSIPGNGLGIASLVLGIISVCTFCVLPLTVVLGVIAIILGVISIAQAGGAPKGKAKAGITLAMIGIVVSVGFWVTVTFILKKAGDTIQAHQGDIQKQLDDVSKKLQEKAQQQANDPAVQKQLQDAGQKLQDAIKKSQTPSGNGQSNPPTSLLTHPDGWSVYVA
jgi:hypothetical protein